MLNIIDNSITLVFHQLILWYNGGIEVCGNQHVITQNFLKIDVLFIIEKMIL